MSNARRSTSRAASSSITPSSLPVLTKRPHSGGESESEPEGEDAPAVNKANTTEDGETTSRQEKKFRRKKRRKVPIVSHADGSTRASATPTPDVRHEEGEHDSKRWEIGLGRILMTPIMEVDSKTSAPRVEDPNTAPNTPHASRIPEAGPSRSIREGDSTYAQATDSAGNDLPVPVPPPLFLPASSTSPSGSTKGKERATANSLHERRWSPTGNADTSNQRLLLKHQALLGTLSQSLTCQICLDILHKPYALAPCGHIACYSCLVSWFTALPAGEEPGPHQRPAWRRKKICPHCRAQVRERPGEVWTIKEMVSTLARSGLVPDFDPPAVDAAAIPAAPAQDPWRGIFRPPDYEEPPLGGEAAFALADDPDEMGFRDLEDGGVYRCVDCMHEIWEGFCTHCGREYPGHAHHDDADDVDIDLGLRYDDFDDDEDDGSDDGYGDAGLDNDELMHIIAGAMAQPEDDHDEIDGPHLHRVPPPNGYAAGMPRGAWAAEFEPDSDDELEVDYLPHPAGHYWARRLPRAYEEEEEEEGYEDSFIDDEEGVPHLVGEEDVPHVINIDDDDDEEEFAPAPPRRHYTRRIIEVSDDDDVQDGDDDDPEVAPGPPPRPIPTVGIQGRRNALIVLSDSEYEHDEGDQQADRHRWHRGAGVYEGGEGDHWNDYDYEEERAAAEYDGDGASADEYEGPDDYW